jgi:flavin-dependent dehydrogenase
MRRTAALIVGGGPAGSAAAIVLGRAGLRPELIERSAGPHDVVCGGFLGWDALASLRRLGVDTSALGARPIHRLRLIAGTRVVEASLPHAAAGLSRRRLDEALLAAASEAGAVVMRGRAARAGDAGTRTIRLDNGQEIAAEALFLATGKHELRGLARGVGTEPGQLSVGLRQALPASAALQAALDGVIELHLFDGGYAGLLLQEDGGANLCLSAVQGRLSDTGGVQGLVAQVAAEAPILGERLEGASERWEAIAGVPYGWRSRATSEGVFRLGDQSAVIASLAGDGVAIALRSGEQAATAMLLSGAGAAGADQAAFARRAALPLAVASSLRHAAETPWLRPLLMGAAGVPGLARLAARLTRIG